MFDLQWIPFIGFWMGRKMFDLLIIWKMSLQNFMFRDWSLIGHVSPGMPILGIEVVVGNTGLSKARSGIELIRMKDSYI